MLPLLAPQTNIIIFIRIICANVCLMLNMADQNNLKRSSQAICNLIEVQSNLLGMELNHNEEKKRRRKMQRRFSKVGKLFKKGRSFRQQSSLPPRGLRMGPLIIEEGGDTNRSPNDTTTNAGAEVPNSTMTTEQGMSAVHKFGTIPSCSEQNPALIHRLSLDQTPHRKKQVRRLVSAASSDLEAPPNTAAISLLDDDDDDDDIQIDCLVAAFDDVSASR